MTNDEKTTMGPADAMSENEFAALGEGMVAYIKELSSEEAGRLFPTVHGLPMGVNLYSLHSADGTPIALTDSRQAALGHAIEDNLEVASVH